mgnify:CR=1 FL=1
MNPANPLLRPTAILLVMLSHSIGWGIRGNYGHEFGAMMPGALSALAISLFSGREDWRRRAPFFAVFGALGWAFGGSMSYMPPLAYTHSGHLPTQLYGFLMVFAIGFLWTSLGAAGTAYAAVETRERLTAFFQPLCWILAAWTLQYWLEPALVRRWIEARAPGAAAGSFRQLSPLYWLDSDWLGVSLALLALCGYDLWSRRFDKFTRLITYAATAAAAGFLVQRLLAAVGWLEPLARALVSIQGDPSAINPATGQPFDPAVMITNSPWLFMELGPHMGWLVGLVAGWALYFARYGQWRNGARLPLYMGVCGFAVFLAGPVLLSNLLCSVGGFRMVTPRGDNWAFVLGYLLGVIVYMRRRKLEGVVTAAIVGGVLGGLGLMVAQFLKILAWMPGNPLLTQDPGVIAAWSHWRSANWHSLLAEQGAGLFYGLAVLVALALVWERTPSAAEEPRVRRWTELFCVSFILNLLVYVNLVKNVADWTRLQPGGFRAVPLTMKAPLLGFIELSARAWFDLTFALFTVTTIALLVRHSRKPLAVVPSTWLGKGQLFYLVFLWIIVAGNFTKALVAFHQTRLATEWLVAVNAMAASYLILAFPPPDCGAPRGWRSYAGIVRKTAGAGLPVVLLLVLSFTAVVRSVYGDRHDGYGNRNLRFGPEADWKVRPVLLDAPHR